MSKQAEFNIDKKKEKLIKKNIKVPNKDTNNEKSPRTTRTPVTPRSPREPKSPKSPKSPKFPKKDIEKKDYSKYQENKPIYNDDDIKQLLIGYDLIPESEWTKIKSKSHIRYIKSDGSFARGGFVKNHFIRDNINGIYLENSLGANNVGWAITLNNISKIWKKRTADDIKFINLEEKIMHTSADTLSIESRLDILEIENKQLKNDIQNILKWINRQKSSGSSTMNRPQTTNNNTRSVYAV